MEDCKKPKFPVKLSLFREQEKTKTPKNFQIRNFRSDCFQKMVASKIFDLRDSSETGDDLAIPDMMFAQGEEPLGVRVLTYQSSRAINFILNALHEDEVEAIRASAFGKLVEIAEKPAFSGRFTRFTISTIES